MEDEQMTELDKLDNLIDVVEAGEDYVERHIQRAFGGYRSSANSAYINRAYNGSLDAALALHEALLPGWALERLTKWPGTNGQCTAYLWGTHEDDGERWHNAKDGRVDANGPTPARAWLLAILRAYRSVQA